MRPCAFSFPSHLGGVLDSCWEYLGSSRANNMASTVRMWAMMGNRVVFWREIEDFSTMKKSAEGRRDTTEEIWRRKHDHAMGQTFRTSVYGLLSLESPI